MWCGPTIDRSIAAATKQWGGAGWPESFSVTTRVARLVSTAAREDLMGWSRGALVTSTAQLPMVV